MSWCQLEDSFWSSPKINVDLVSALECPVALASGLVANLWAWCLTSAQDGDLDGKTEQHIAFACKWDGDPTVLVDALVSAQLLDRDNGKLSVHNWLSRASSWKAAQKKAQIRAKKNDVSRDSPETVRDTTDRGDDLSPREERRGEEKKRKESSPDFRSREGSRKLPLLDSGEPLFHLPTKKGRYPVTAERVGKLSKEYPGVGVRAQLEDYRDYLETLGPGALPVDAVRGMRNQCKRQQGFIAATSSKKSRGPTPPRDVYNPETGEIESGDA